MDEKIKKLVLGGLLHDIGKIVQRSEHDFSRKTHSRWGAEYLISNGIHDEEILAQVLYHHNSKKHHEIKEAYKEKKIKEDSLAYITYCADNIAAASDRRGRGEDYDGWFYKRFAPLYSVFNSLNDNGEPKREYFRFNKSILFDERKIPYPEAKIDVVDYDHEYYKKILNSTIDTICKAINDWDFINVALNNLEQYWTCIPDSTNVARELVDISLYDHVKMTAAFGCCMYLYEKHKGITDYRGQFLLNSKEFYKEKAFVMYGLDVSGIQRFIYTVHSDGALKTLRARSFYIEILLQYIVDILLEKIGLTRVNVLYLGGGHADLLLPNVPSVLKQIEQTLDEVNNWLIGEFRTSLYLENGYCICSAHDLNAKKDDLKQDYSTINSVRTRMIQEKKVHRYSYKKLIELNSKCYQNHDGNTIEKGDRECKVCHRIDNLVNKKSMQYYFKDQEEDEYLCKFCMSVLLNSSNILNRSSDEEMNIDKQFKFDKDIFYIIDSCQETNMRNEYLLPLPFDKKLLFADQNTQQDHYWKSYSKNKICSVNKYSTFLWIADYRKTDDTCDTTEEMVKLAKGIDRIAVIRADVDDLGKAFAHGFEGKEGAYDCNTISRKVTFSRMMSLFFKYHISYILEHGESYLSFQEEKKQRNAVTVYAGGDDLFLVGSWDDIIEFAIDLYRKFGEYTQNKLTLSAGIGIYPAKYPMSSIAQEVGALQEKAKMNEGKNSVTLFHEDFKFHWDCFYNKVIGEKYRLISDFMSSCGERGNSFLYHLLDLLKSVEKNPISLARYAFFISKFEPTKRKEESDEEFAKRKTKYSTFREEIYKWMDSARKQGANIDNDKNDVKQCILAIYLYIYQMRKKEEKVNE